jgi:2-methylisocitrate lyase-like PEP mutase family enzyme
LLIFFLPFAGKWRAKNVTTPQNKDRCISSDASGPPILVLPNAWDAVSARLFVKVGAKAIATTGAGIAATLGYPGGQKVPAKLMLEAVARTARVADVPVTGGQRPPEVAVNS